MSGDLKTGIIGLAAIVALIVAVRFIRKANLFDRNPTIHAVFRSTQGIDVNNDVMLNGLRVGKVVKLEPSDKTVSRVKVSMKLNRKLNIPVNSVAHILPSAMSAPKIVIENGNSKTYLSNNDVIPTKEGDGVMENLQAQAKPLAEKIRNITDSLSLTLNQYNTKLDIKKQADLRRRIESLNAQMAGYAAMAKRMDVGSAAYVNSLRATTGSYTAKREQINQSISGINKKITELNQMGLGRKVDSLNEKIAGFNRRISGINSGKLGALTSGREDYNAINAELLQTEIMLDDIRINPERYLNISVFGKSSKAPEQTMPEAAKQRQQRNIEFNRNQQEKYKNR